MLCRLCRQGMGLATRRSSMRTITTTSASQSAPSDQTAAISSSTPGISQPISSQNPPKFAKATTGVPEDILEAKKTKLQSSVPGGAELKGLAYIRAKPQILAKEDDQYPAWLWTLLDEASQGGGKNIVDVASMTKKQRAKYERKQANLLRDMPKTIPIHEQSKDLTDVGDGPEISLQRRQEITKSSREARRKSIRESNFLRSM